jgi:hypothetical protein
LPRMEPEGGVRPNGRAKIAAGVDCDTIRTSRDGESSALECHNHRPAQTQPFSLIHNASLPFIRLQAGRRTNFRPRSRCSWDLFRDHEFYKSLLGNRLRFLGNFFPSTPRIAGPWPQSTQRRNDGARTSATPRIEAGTPAYPSVIRQRVRRQVASRSARPTGRSDFRLYPNPDPCR